MPHSDSLLNLLQSNLDGKVVDAHYSELDIDESWNARTGNWKDDLDELQKSLEHGQDVPVVVRPNPKNVSGKPWSVISGFSRCESIHRNAESSGRDPIVKVIVRVVDEGQALAINIRENQARNPLKLADVAVQMWRLYCWNEENKGVYMQVDEISSLTGTSTLVVTRLLEVMRKASPKLIEAWQKSRIEIPLIDLVLVVRQYRKDEQLQGLRLIQSTPRRKASVSYATGRSVSTMRRAKELGTILGVLEAEGYITVNKADFEEMLGYVFTMVPSRRSYRRQVIAGKLRDAYLSASNRIIDVEGEDDDHYQETE